MSHGLELNNVLLIYTESKNLKIRFVSKEAKNGKLLKK